MDDDSIKVVDRLTDMEQFIAESRLVPDQDETALLKRIFRYEDQELETMQFFGMFRPSVSIDSLEKQLNRLKSLGFEEDIEQELMQLQREYPSNGRIQFELYVLDAENTFVISRMGGVSAFTDWSGRIVFRGPSGRTCKEDIEICRES